MELAIQDFMVVQVHLPYLWRLTFIVQITGSTPPTTCKKSITLLFYGPSVDESIDTVTSYVRFCYDICYHVEKLFIYPHKISSPFLKRLRRKKEHFSRLNDFINVKLISSNIQAQTVRLNSIFASHLSNCEPSRL